MALNFELGGLPNYPLNAEPEKQEQDPSDQLGTYPSHEIFNGETIGIPDWAGPATRALSELEPSGDPVADMRKIDRLANEGRLLSMIDSRGRALRLCVSIREDFETGPLGDVATAPLYYQRFSEAEKEALLRVLDFYGVTATTTKEFDDLEQQNKPENILHLQAIRAFKPTGDIAADTPVLLAIVNDKYLTRRYDAGESVERILRDLIRQRKEGIALGTDRLIPEARYERTHFDPIELEKARAVLELAGLREE